MRTNLEIGSNKPDPQKNMKNKIIIATVFAMASAFFLTGCIVVNVEKTAPSGSCTSTNAVVTPTK
jgi:hypothetical protein